MGQNFITEEEAERLRHNPESISRVLEKYRRKSISVTTDVLREEWDDNDYLNMLFFR